MISSNGALCDLLWTVWTVAPLCFPSCMCRLCLWLYICYVFEASLSVMSLADGDSSFFMSLMLCCAFCLMFQVRCVWTNPATVGKGLDPPGHSQAVPLSSWVSALINHGGRMNCWSVVSAVWVWFPIVSLCGVEIFSQCLRGVLSCAWLSNFTSNQGRVSVEN